MILPELQLHRLGINLHPVHCPKCGAPMPALRMPTSLVQFLLGGWTCPACNAHIDKWGDMEDDEAA